METSQILKADVLDIVFEHRNKTYGAYELRKSYCKRLTTAVLVMLGCCVLTFVVATATTSNTLHSSNLVVDGEVHIQQLDPVQPPVPPPPPPPPPPAPRQIITIRFTTPVLVNETETPPPAQNTLDNVAIGKLDNPNGEQGDVVMPPMAEHGAAAVTPPQINEFDGEVFIVQ